MIRVTINDVKFSVFQKDEETFLCTGDVVGEPAFEFAGSEVVDWYDAIGATSVVSGKTTNVDELYKTWLEQTKFHREVMGKTY